MALHRAAVEGSPVLGESIVCTLRIGYQGIERQVLAKVCHPSAMLQRSIGRNNITHHKEQKHEWGTGKIKFRSIFLNFLKKEGILWSMHALSAHTIFFFFLKKKTLLSSHFHVLVLVAQSYFLGWSANTKPPRRCCLDRWYRMWNQAHRWSWYKAVPWRPMEGAIIYLGGNILNSWDGPSKSSTKALSPTLSYPYTLWSFFFFFYYRTLTR